MALKSDSRAIRALAGMAGGGFGACVSLMIIWREEIASFYVYGLRYTSPWIYWDSPWVDTLWRLAVGLVAGMIAGSICNTDWRPRMAAWIGLVAGFLLSTQCILPPGRYRE